MIRLGWLQFKQSWHIWILTSGSFILAGWLLGTCLTGIISLRVALPVLLAAGHDPLPLFLMPLVLGGLTLFMVLTGIIRAVLNEFGTEYRLWTIQGANSRQLSVLISVQLGLMGLIGSAVGWLLAIGTISLTYGWLQHWLGREWLPSVPFPPTGVVLVLTIGGIMLLSGLSGYINTRRILLQQATTHRNLHWLVLGGRGILLVLSMLQLGKTVIQIHSTGGNALFVAMILLVVIQIILGRIGSVWLLKLLAIGLRVHHHTILNVAYRQVYRRSEQLASVTEPLLMTHTILVTILLMLYGFGGGPVDVQNVMASILVYVGAPMLVVIVNGGTIMLLESYHQTANLQQLVINGMTPADLMRERFWESGLYALVFLLGALLVDGFLFGMVGMLDFTQLHVILRIIVVVPMAIAGGVWLCADLINSWYLHQWKGVNQKSVHFV